MAKHDTFPSHFFFSSGEEIAKLINEIIRISFAQFMTGGRAFNFFITGESKFFTKMDENKLEFYVASSARDWGKKGRPDSIKLSNFAMLELCFHFNWNLLPGSYSVEGTQKPFFGIVVIVFSFGSLTKYLWLHSSFTAS